MGWGPWHQQGQERMEERDEVELCGHGLLRRKVIITLPFEQAHDRSGRRKMKERAVPGANVFEGEMGCDGTNSQNIV